MGASGALVWCVTNDTWIPFRLDAVKLSGTITKAHWESVLELVRLLASNQLVLHAGSSSSSPSLMCGQAHSFDSLSSSFPCSTASCSSTFSSSAVFEDDDSSSPVVSSQKSGALGNDSCSGNLLNSVLKNDLIKVATKNSKLTTGQMTMTSAGTTIGDCRAVSCCNVMQTDLEYCRFGKEEIPILSYNKTDASSDGQLFSFTSEQVDQTPMIGPRIKAAVAFNLAPASQVNMSGCFSKNSTQLEFSKKHSSEFCSVLVTDTSLTRLENDDDANNGNKTQLKKKKSVTENDKDNVKIECKKESGFENREKSYVPQETPSWLKLLERYHDSKRFEKQIQRQREAWARNKRHLRRESVPKCLSGLSRYVHNLRFVYYN